MTRKRENQQRKDVMIMYTRPDNVPGQFCDNLADLILHDGANRRLIKTRASLMSGPRIANARNELMRAFIAQEAEWAWLTDADMTFSRKIVYNLLHVATEMDLTLVGGLAFTGGRGYGIEPAIFTERGGVPYGVQDYPDNAPVKVWATGAACLLVHRSVALDVQKLYGDRAHPWFEELDVDGKQWGEDVTFCRRAFEAGHEPVVHTGIEVGHMHYGALLCSQEFRRRQQLTPEQRGVEEANWYRMMGIASE